jgi:hypothetical protein
VIEYDIGLGNPPFRIIIEGIHGPVSQLVFDAHVKKSVLNKTNKFIHNGPFVLDRRIFTTDHPHVIDFKEWLIEHFGLKKVVMLDGGVDGCCIVYGEQGYKGEIIHTNNQVDTVDDSIFKQYNNPDRQARQDKTREYFSPIEWVMTGLDLLPQEQFKDNTISYCDTSAGEGVWLVGVAMKRMQNGMTHKEAIQNLKAVELMQDNRDTIVKRLMCDDESLKQTLEQNIIVGDWLNEISI